MPFVKEDGLWTHEGVTASAASMLAVVAGACEEELGRKPKLAELMATLGSVLYRDAEQYTSDCEERLVVEVKAKTKKRPRKQEPQVGDVFVIKLRRNDLAFGRVTPIDGWFEFFEQRRRSVPRVSELKGDRRVYIDSRVFSHGFTDGTWRIVGNMPFKKGEWRPSRFKIPDGDVMPWNAEQQLRDLTKKPTE